MYVLEHGLFATRAPMETNLLTMGKRNLFLLGGEHARLAMTFEQVQFGK